MKFSHSLLFSTVPEWQPGYVAYDELKAKIYTLEKQLVVRKQQQKATQKHSLNIQVRYQDQTLEHQESEGLLDSNNGNADDSSCSIPVMSGTDQFSEPDQLFLKLLLKELDKVERFYEVKETELADQLSSLIAEIEKIEKREFTSGPLNEHHNESALGDDEDDDDDDEDDDHNIRGDEGAHGSQNKTFESRSSKFFGRDQLLRSAKAFGILPILSSSQKTSPSKPIKSRGRQSAVHPVIGVAAYSDEPQGSTSDLIDMRPSHEVSSTQTSTKAVLRSTKPPAQRSLSTGVRAQNAPPVQRRFSVTKPVSTPSKTQRSHSLHHPTDRNRTIQGISVNNLVDFWACNLEFIHDSKIFFKRSLTESFVNLNGLKNYINLNFTAFRKILKKYDKVFKSSLSAYFLDEVLIKRSKTFDPSTKARVCEMIQSLIPIYARVVSQGDEEMAKKQLDAHLREQVVWERNTIWREMIGLERKGWTNPNKIPIDKPFIRESNSSHDEGLLLVSANAEKRPFGRFLRSLFGLRFWRKLVIRYSVFWSLVALMTFISIIQFGNFKSEAEKNCLAMLVFVIVLWTTEAIPLFVTGFFVPLLIVVLRVIKNEDDERVDSIQATSFVFSHMLSPTIILLLGAFTIAAILSKQNIDKVMAAKLLSLAGSSPRKVLLAYMGVTCFASMWISNVAAPILSYSLAQPILRTLPTKSPFARSLVLGIALSADIGGQTSPIASPQNLIALEYMSPPPSWLSWFFISIPVSGLSIISIWMLLIWSHEREFDYSELENLGESELFIEANSKQINRPIVYIKPISAPKDPFTFQQWFVLLISLSTIILWCFDHQIKHIFGDMGIIALIPMIVYFGTGLLSKSDFDNFPWSIVFLAMSGIVLGKSVLASGLLNDLDQIIEGLIQGLSLWPITMIFSLIVLMISTFISHTVASVLLIPIANEVGKNLNETHSKLLIMITTLICSAGMGLPVSGFPNQTAINLEDELGTRYLNSNDFLKFGLPSSIISTLIIVTIGYLIMLLLGF